METNKKSDISIDAASKMVTALCHAIDDARELEAGGDLQVSEMITAVRAAHKAGIKPACRGRGGCSCKGVHITPLWASVRFITTTIAAEEM